MTSPVTPRELLLATVRLRGEVYTVKGFLEDGCFIPDSFTPYIEYNSLSDTEWAEVDYQFWAQQAEPVEDDDSPERKDDVKL